MMNSEKLINLNRETPEIGEAIPIFRFHPPFLSILPQGNIEYISMGMGMHGPAPLPPPQGLKTNFKGYESIQSILDVALLT